jgi:hypothetical protein
MPGTPATVSAAMHDIQPPQFIVSQQTVFL